MGGWLGVSGDAECLAEGEGPGLLGVAVAVAVAVVAMDGGVVHRPVVGGAVARVDRVG